MPSSAHVSGCVLNKSLKNGVYTIIRCRATVRVTAPSRGLLESSPILKMDSCRDRMASAIPNWLKHSTVKAMVCQCAMPARRAQASVPMVKPPTSAPTNTMNQPRPLAKMFWRGSMGGRCILFFSDGS